MAAPSPIQKGLAILWGTNNTVASPAGAIWESIQVTPKNSGPLAEIENNDGAGVNLVLLVDGFEAKCTAVYDNAKAWPAEGTNVGLQLPTNNGNANANATTFYCTLVSVQPSLARKKEATIELSLIYRPGITP